MPVSGPLWLRIVLGLAPLLAALVGGAFILANTVGRRIEQLKNLADLRNSLPASLNPDYALERLIIRELWAIERAATPFYRWYRRGLITTVAIYPAVTLLTSIPGIRGTGWTTVLIVVALAMMVLGGLVLRLLHSRLSDLDHPHKVQVIALEKRLDDERHPREGQPDSGRSGRDTFRHSAAIRLGFNPMVTGRGSRSSRPPSSKH